MSLKDFDVGFEVVAAETWGFGEGQVVLIGPDAEFKVVKDGEVEMMLSRETQHLEKDAELGFRQLTVMHLLEPIILVSQSNKTPKVQILSTEEQENLTRITATKEQLFIFNKGDKIMLPSETVVNFQTRTEILNHFHAMISPDRDLPASSEQTFSENHTAHFNTAAFFTFLQPAHLKFTHPTQFLFMPVQIPRQNPSKTSIPP